MRVLSADYILLRRIGECANELLKSKQKAGAIRLSDLYDSVSLKQILPPEIPSSVEFSRFMRRMHDEHNDVFKSFIPNSMVDTSIFYHYAWRFYPTIREFNVEEPEYANVLSDGPKSTGNFFKSSKLYEAPNGVMVRSKVEQYILTRLLEITHFDVYYEYPLIAGGEKKYPDFTIYNSYTEAIFYWEHFGLSENSTYFDGMNSKLKWYRSIGFKPIDEGGCLVTTTFYEDSNSLTILVDQMIRKMDDVVVPEGYFMEGHEYPMNSLKKRKKKKRTKKP